MRSPAVEIEGLRAGYPDRPVLSGVDLRLEAGEIVGLLGPNGVGKTTLIRCVTGRLRPADGRVRVLGESVSGQSVRRLARALGVVHQSYQLPRGFSVKAVVAMGRSPHLGLLSHESESDWRIVDETLAEVGIAHLEDRATHELSGGERQKVALSIALAQRPSVLVLDEPTAHLDLRHQAEVMTLVESQRRDRGLAVLAVLHDINLAARHCDRLVFLLDGRVAASGAPAEVLDEEVLSSCFGTPLRVVDDPETGLPVVVPALAGAGAASRESVAREPR